VINLIINNPKFKILNRESNWFHFLLLLVWIAIGTGLRFTHLASKPPWSDEFATLVFSLGHSFRTVPLNQAIALDTLLMPLQPDAEFSIGGVIHHLMTESTHPPIYFVLTHLWLKLFPADGGIVSLWAARSLSAIFGAASIPAMFGFGWFAFRSRLVGQMAAAMMAVSPFGIYLAQEARHYTLAILFLIASMCCLIMAIRHIQRQIALPVWVGLIWVVVNSLGIAIHYFFALSIAAEALVLLGFWLGELKRKDSPYFSIFSKHCLRLYAIAAGTLMGGLVWLPALQRVPDNDLTEWIHNGHIFSHLLEPVARLVAWTITMLVLLPVEGTTLPVAIASAVLMLIFTLWVLQIFIRSLRVQMEEPTSRLAIQIFGGFTIAAIAIFFCITYAVGNDLTLAARYHFVYFPAVVVLLGSTVAFCWEALPQEKVKIQAKDKPGILSFDFYPLPFNEKKAVALVLLMVFLSGLTVVFNFGYQKADRPDLVFQAIVETQNKASSNVPMLIATVHKTHEQTGEMMGLAREFKSLISDPTTRYILEPSEVSGVAHQHKNAYNRSLEPTATNFLTSLPQFLLAHKGKDALQATNTLYRTLAQMPRPLDLWVVNFSAHVKLESQKCIPDPQGKAKVAGYKYRLYHCL
jgi:uncharacterized membrane protein